MRPGSAPDRSYSPTFRESGRRLRASSRRNGERPDANPMTGPIGVVAMNMSRLGRVTSDEHNFVRRLDKLMEMARTRLLHERYSAPSRLSVRRIGTWHSALTWDSRASERTENLRRHWRATGRAGAVNSLCWRRPERSG
ncbi:MAG: anaerobic ribonucleoside-triphosphate reductase [Planctomycetota bacterium]